ncbi:MAG: hypothetical protein KF861_02250 [Planctomycetaceae bacterium]|nr:hypothetical protein [Planctomycetaceae bacterium]
MYVSRFCLPWVSGLFALLSQIALASAQDIPASPRDLEMGAVESRQAIRCGHITATTRGLNGQGEEHKVVYECWFNADQSQQRMDRLDPSTGWTEVNCYGCAGDARRHVFYTDRIIPGMGGAALRIQSSTIMQRALRMDPDVRFIGIATDGFLNLGHLRFGVLTDNIGRMQDESIEVTMLDDQTCWLVSWVRLAPQGTGVRATEKTWFAEHLGRNIIRKEIQSTNAMGEFIAESEIHCELQFHAASGIWFPAVVDYRHVEPGRPEWKEHLEITVHSFNEPIPEGTFELTGIEILKPGTGVSWLEGEGHGPPPGNGPFVWNGSEIIVDYEHARKNMLPLSKAPEKVRDPLRIALVLVNLLALLTGAVYYGRLHFREKANLDRDSAE